LCIKLNAVKSQPWGFQTHPGTKNPSSLALDNEVVENKDPLAGPAKLALVDSWLQLYAARAAMDQYACAWASLVLQRDCHSKTSTTPIVTPLCLCFVFVFVFVFVLALVPVFA
jgi:hypothetical protein